MSTRISPVIQPNDLLLLNGHDYILIDASAGSKERYEEKHLDGALFADVNNDLAHVNDFSKGGRHPLPHIEPFGKVLGKFGITPERHVIIYDDKNGANAAARFWWMLRAIGHEKVQVVNGGFEAAIHAGFPLSSKTVQAEAAKPYPVTDWNLPLSDMQAVETFSKRKDYLIIDVRDADRFNGHTEPIDLIAGHIPGATNVPFTENLDHHGNFHSPETLNKKYNEILAGIPSNRVIVHCGSGITACHTLLAMDYAGLKIPNLYVGSWSEWSRNNKEMVLAKTL